VNLALAAGTFAVIIPAELPDKTFISAVVLSSKHRPLPVWAGTASGLIVQAGVAVGAGRLLALLPHRSVEVIVAVLFLAGAAYLLFVPERSAQAQGIAAARREESELAQARAGVPSPMRVALTTFVVVTLAEFGDLTQVILANLTARSGDPLSVFAGAAGAFVLVSGIGVAAGRVLTRYVPLAALRRLSGIVLAGLGAWSLAGALGA
jgi:putative Ca2+/H+ antiporter (TMEM165/GDT1 family)